MRIRTFVGAVLFGIMAACGGGGSPIATVSIPALPAGISATPLVLVAGMELLEPSTDPMPAGLDFDRLGLTAPPTFYDLTAVADWPFEFDLLSQGVEMGGQVAVSIAHVKNGDETPTTGTDSIARAGIMLSGTGGTPTGLWQIYSGDGFARATFHGRVDREQVFAVTALSALGESTAVIRIRPGTESKILLPSTTHGDYPGVLESQVLYSSPSPDFGLPVAAVSGDRTTVICYEGDRGAGLGERYELRMQYDHVTGSVSGGAQQETNSDSGNWRDHDVASLFNVVARAHAGDDGVDVALSFDRGATFAQTEQLHEAGLTGQARLVSIAMAADYSLAVSFWRPATTGGNELIVVRGAPDDKNAPARFTFETPRAVHFERATITPLMTGLAWSDGGDLVIGYGFTRSTVLQSPRLVVAQTICRCAVLPWNADEFIDTLVDWEEQVFSRDPSVSAVGAYPNLKILYAYESRDGVKLASSRDGGRSFSQPRRIGPQLAYMPTVIARGDRVDLFQLAFTNRGTELLLHQWDDFENGAMNSYRLTQAISKPVREFESQGIPGGVSVSNATLVIVETDIRQVGRFGYDVTQAGDELHVVIHEDHDHRYLWVETLGLSPGERLNFRGGSGRQEPFEPVQPPPLAEGLTGPLPAPDASHRHELRLLRLR